MEKRTTHEAPISWGSQIKLERERENCKKKKVGEGRYQSNASWLPSLGQWTQIGKVEPQNLLGDIKECILFIYLFIYLAVQVAGITGMYYHTWFVLFLIIALWL
jgi:hypothetical protein